MKCPGLHCLGCRSNGSGAGVLIIGGADRRRYLAG